MRCKWWALAAVAFSLAACGADSNRDAELPGLDRCVRDSDCPAGLVCVEQACVADDGQVPEKPDPRTFLPPASSRDHVFALSPDANAVAVIDPLRLEVQAIPLPSEPLDLAVLPGEDAILVLSRAGAALSLLSLGDDGPKLSIRKLPRKLSSLSLSPDASWAVVWTRDGQALDAGAEGLVLLVDVGRLRDGTPDAAIERVAGRRHTDVVFRSDPSGAARDAVVVGKEEIAVFDLSDPASQPTPARVELPATHAEIATRRVAASPDGAFVLIASLVSPDLLVFDVEGRSLRALVLPAPPSDLAVGPGGRLALLPLRSASKAAWFTLPDALGDPGAIRVADVSLPGAACETPGCVVAPGQARLSPDGTFALLFTSAQQAKSFGRLDLATGDWRVFDRIRKEVRTIAIAPTGSHAIVLHRPRPDSTAADQYEREVDRAEGYSVVALESGAGQLVLTDQVPPLDAVFAGGSRYAAVTLRSDAASVFRLDSIDLETLVSTPLRLSSAPEYAGPLAPSLDGRIWVTQVHPAGRISFVDLASRSTRTLTGYELNGEIE